jgi:hypothetical protein
MLSSWQDAANGSSPGYANLPAAPKPEPRAASRDERPGDTLSSRLDKNKGTIRTPSIEE